MPPHLYLPPPSSRSISVMMWPKAKISSTSTHEPVPPNPHHHPTPKNHKHNHKKGSFLGARRPEVNTTPLATTSSFSMPLYSNI